MTTRQLVIAPHPVLTAVAAEVPRVDDDVRALLDDLVETMFTEDGVGLAAPQVGVSQRAIAVNIDPAGDGVRAVMSLVNPVIVEREGTHWGGEGCLSVPKLHTNIQRATRVVVEAADRNGESVRFEAVGHAARVLQHEIDHLDGITILKWATPAKRKKYLRSHRPQR